LLKVKLHRSIYTVYEVRIFQIFPRARVTVDVGSDSASWKHGVPSRTATDDPLCWSARSV